MSLKSHPHISTPPTELRIASERAIRRGGARVPYFIFTSIKISKIIIIVVGAILIEPNHINSATTTPIPKAIVEITITNFVILYNQ